MKDLKFLLVTSSFNELGVSLYSMLNEIGTCKSLDSRDNNAIINTIIQSEIDVVFLDVVYLGNMEVHRIFNLIENITGKACIYIQKNSYKEFENLSNLFSAQKYGCIDYNVLRIDLISLIIDALNTFNNNKLLRKEKCYDFIYIVWEDLNIKKVEIKSIKEILKKDKATFLICNERFNNKRVINITFELLYKLLNNNFVKSRFKIINKDWLNKNIIKDVLFLKNSA